MATNESAQNATRLSDWIPLDMKGKPLYAGIDESQRIANIRTSINTVRVKWNDPEKRRDLVQRVETAVKAKTFSRDLRSALHAVLKLEKFWVDQKQEKFAYRDVVTEESIDGEDYSALEVYTTNEGYKNIFGYINQIFRKYDVDEIEIQGAVTLVELLTIDLYNLRLANFGCSKYYNFQGIVHRGLSVDEGVLDTFRGLMRAPLQNRNFGVPLAFVSTSARLERIQEFLKKAGRKRFRLHWKIHVHELQPSLLAQYHARYPKSVVSTICAMPISQASEFPNEQEILLRGPLFHIVRMYEAPDEDHIVHVVEMVMLNANRDHATELADDQGENKQQRTHFGQICSATKFQICASLARGYGLPEAAEYEKLAKKLLEDLRIDDIDAPFSQKLSDSWSVSRPSWIGASLEISFPKYYAKRRATLSLASFEGLWGEVKSVIDEEYDWQKHDWCNVPRLYDTAADAANASGFTVLHQAAYNNAPPDFVQMLIDCGAWRTMKSQRREDFVTAREVAVRRGNERLIGILEPTIHYDIAADELDRLEVHLHDLMWRLAGRFVNFAYPSYVYCSLLTQIEQHAVRLPQLRVMTEMAEAKPSLWVPVPGMYGGFVLDLDPDTPSLHVVRVSSTYPTTKTAHTITADGVCDID